MPIGTVPGAVAPHLRIIEHLVHGFDPAQATGQPTNRLPADLAEAELALAHTQLAGAPRTGQPFGPAQPVATDAPAVAQLAGYIRRPVR